jgi:uncharacterized OsmC-like protein
MKFSAHVSNQSDDHRVTLKVGDQEQSLSIAPKGNGGSSITGGELLFLALATCFCNDIYREAANWNIQVHGVDVEVEGDFEAPGKSGTNIVYRARVQADASDDQIRELILHTDALAEIQNTVRQGTPVRLEF